EALIVFALSAAANAVLAALARAVAFVGQNIGAFVAGVFLFLPVAAAQRHKLDLAAYGFTLRRFWRSLAYAAVAPAIILPAFAIGYVAFQEHFCTLALPAWTCRQFAGLAGLAHPRLPVGFADLALGQLVVAAIPEELFFRGYLLSLLEDAHPPRRRLLGGG